MANLSENIVLEALRKVQDPDLHQDLVTLNMVRDVRVTDEGDVSVRVVLTTPACPMKAKIERDVRSALEAIPGIGKIEIEMDAQVRSRGASSVQPIPGVSQIIAVSSGKGGVGKSTVAVNLACALKEHRARVGLMDADIYGPNIPTMMGVKGEPDMVMDPDLGEMLIPPESYGIKVMSMGFLVDPDHPAIWRGPMLHNMLQQFCQRVKWADLDYLVIDMPPGTGDVQISLGQLVPITAAVLVTTPQEVSAQDVRKAYNMFEKVRIPVVGIVENMSYFTCDQCHKRHELFGSGGGLRLAQKFSVPLLAQIPMVPQVREGGDQGAPIVMKNPEAEASGRFRDLAGKIVQRISQL